MSSIDSNEKLGIISLGDIKTWLASRPGLDVEDKVTISAPDALRSIGFADLIVEKFGIYHQDLVTSSQDPNNAQKPYPWTELNHLVNWTADFQHTLSQNVLNVALLDSFKGCYDYPITAAKLHVEESIRIAQHAINFELGLDITHPDTRGQNYAVTNIMFDDSTLVTDLVSQIFGALFSKCLVRVVVKSNQFFSAILATLLIDLMYQSGASRKEICCLALDRRDSLGGEMRFVRSLAARKTSKLSTLAIVFNDTDTFAVAGSIIDSYFRQLYPNLLVLVEESSYERFVRDWQRYYSHVLGIGNRFDIRTIVIDDFNSKVQIDLECIDIKQAHKMTNYCINVLKFRNPTELTSLLSNLRKVPYMSLWNEDQLFLRAMCNRINICQEFWLNHVPKYPTDRQLNNDMLNFYAASVAPDMTNLYNSIAQDFNEEMNALRKLHTAFIKKDTKVRTNLIIQAYSSILAKNKSLKNGQTPSESIARLRRFQTATLHTIVSDEPGNSRVEIIRKPVGLAVIVVREMENSVKSRQVLIEFIMKNLLLGNGVLLVCPHNALGAKFAIENDHVIPFKMVHYDEPDISKLSLDDNIDNVDANQVKKQCPSNTFVIELLPDMSSDVCESITIAVGTRAKELWFLNEDHSNYWAET